MAQSSNTFDFLVKTLIIGNSGVGKTSFIYRYCEGQFLSNFYCSCGGIDFRIKTIDIDDKKAKLQIWDTAGQERFGTITQSYYRNVQGIILCYAINDRESFERIEYWMKDITKSAREDVCIVLVGTKSDLSNERVVSIDEGKQMADSYGLKFFETSAKENLNIDEVFLVLTRDAIEVLVKRQNEIGQGDTRLNLKENSLLAKINCFKCY